MWPPLERPQMNASLQWSEAATRSMHEHRPVALTEIAGLPTRVAA